MTKDGTADTHGIRLRSRRNFLKQLATTSLVAGLPLTAMRDAFSLPVNLNGVELKGSVSRHPNWIREARIFGLSVSGLKLDPIALGRDIDSAIEQGGNVIEADSRLSDYLSDEDFGVELELIADAAKIFHERGLKVVWYIPALEIITPNGRLREDSFARRAPGLATVIV